MSSPSVDRYIVLPKRGRAGEIVPGRWNVCLRETKEVVLGPYTVRAFAELVAAALNVGAGPRPPRLPR